MVDAGAGIAIVLGMIFLGFLLPTVFFGLAIGGMVFWIIMLIDVIQRKFKDNNEQTTWIIVVALCGAVGALIYYFMIKKKDVKPEVNKVVEIKNKPKNIKK